MTTTASFSLIKKLFSPRRIFLNLILLILFMSSAQAADPIVALREFGILGIWEENCTAPITDSLRLIRFAETSLGAPRLIISHPDDIIFETTIDAATLIPPDEIQLTVESGFSAPEHLTFRLTGGDLRLVTIPSVPPLHRCVSE